MRFYSGAPPLEIYRFMSLPAEMGAIMLVNEALSVYNFVLIFYNKDKFTPLDMSSSILWRQWYSGREVV